MVNAWCLNVCAKEMQHPEVRSRLAKNTCALRLPCTAYFWCKNRTRKHFTKWAFLAAGGILSLRSRSTSCCPSHLASSLTCLVSTQQGKLETKFHKLLNVHAKQLFFRFSQNEWNQLCPSSKMCCTWRRRIHWRRSQVEAAFSCVLCMEQIIGWTKQHSPSPCTSVYWKAWTRRRVSSTERPTGRSLIVICRKLPFPSMMNNPLQIKNTPCNRVFSSLITYLQLSCHQIIDWNELFFPALWADQFLFKEPDPDRHKKQAQTDHHAIWKFHSNGTRNKKVMLLCLFSGFSSSILRRNPTGEQEANYRTHLHLTNT